MNQISFFIIPADIKIACIEHLPQLVADQIHDGLKVQFGGESLLNGVDDLQLGNPLLLGFEKALGLNPDAVGPLAGLAWARAVAGDPGVRQPEEAIRLAERATALSNRRDPSVLDALAAAYASAQQFDKAVETAREAMQLADSMGLQGLWVDIRTRVKLYEEKQAYIAR